MTTTQTSRISGASSTGAATTDVNAIEDLTGTGLAARTATNTWALRSLTAPAAGITVTNPAGVAGDPTLVLANDLAALEAMSGAGLAVHTGTSTWTERTLASANAAITVANGTGVGGNPTLTLVPATQAEMETGTSVILAVAPGRQQFHASACKCWAYVTVSAGTPTLVTSYNITSITDTATGQLTITFATVFSSANWKATVSVERAATALTVANLRMAGTRFGGIAAGTILIECWDGTATTANAVDPASWHFAGHGDQ